MAKSKVVDKERRPYIGVGVILRREDGHVLLGLRRGVHGTGSWGFPGGHLEYGETLHACAKREVKEETGIDIEFLIDGPCTEDVFEAEGKHYVTLYFIADVPVGTVAENTEPDKIERFEWFRWDALPDPVFLPLRNLKGSGYHPFAIE